MNKRRAITVVTILALTMSAAAYGGESKKNGVPYTIWDAFNDLYLRVEALYAQVQAIQLTPGPAGPRGLQGAPGPQGERGLPGEGALRVVDANGQTVGALMTQAVANGYQHLAVVRTANQVVFLPVNGSGFRDNYVNTLYHTTPDCTGQRYLLTPGADPALTIASTQPAAVQQGYALFPSGAASVQALASRETFGPGADYRSPGLCEAVQLTATVAAARGLELATLQHEGPFRIQ